MPITEATIVVTSDHLDPDELNLFLRGHLPGSQVTRGLTHLLGGCQQCGRLVRRRLDQKRVTSDHPYSQAMLETLAFVLGREAPLAMERIAAPGRVVRLLEMSFEQRRMLVTNDRRYRTWGVCERLLHESRDVAWALHQDTLLDRAETALLVAEHLDPAQYGELHLQDLLAEVQGTLANAFRLRSDFRRARECLDLARQHLARGTGDELDAVRLASLEGSLLMTRGYFEQAVALLREEKKKLVRYNETQLEAKLEVKIGAALAFYDSSAAVGVYETALERIDPRLSPRLQFCACHGLTWSLNEAGRSHEALMQLQRHRRLFRQFPDDWARFHVRWLEARIAFRLGNLEEAEATYQKVWATAFEMDLRLETAIVSLDLIEVQVAQERFSEASDVARSLMDLFSVWRVHTPAVEAQTFLLEALRQRTASGTLVGQVSQYLRRAWKNPKFRFLS